MPEHDDELDRRITATLGLAQQDAPAPALVPLPSPRRTGRILAAAAAVVLVGAAGIALANRDDSAVATVSTTVPVPSVDTTSTPTQSTSAPSSTIPDLPGEPRDCSAPAVDSYDTFGSMHTIVESAQALDIRVEAVDAPWCPGGIGVVRLTVTNVGAGQEELDPVHLILNGGMNKYSLEHRRDESEPDVLSLAPGSGITVEYHVAIPAVPPGSYLLQLYGFGPGTDIRIDGPAACTTDHLSAVAGPGDGAGQHSMTPITVTNIGTTPCFLGKPLIVMGTRPDGTGPEQIPFEEGGFFPVVDPRPSRVLAPGQRSSLILTTVTSCLEPTTDIVAWSSMQMQLSPLGDSTVSVTFGPDIGVQTTCGLAVSAWGAPTE
jgi:hypothetical protein